MFKHGRKRKKISEDEERFWMVPRTHTIGQLRENMERILDNFTLYDIPDPSTADFVLTYSTYRLKGSVRQAKIADYLHNLKEQGLAIRKAPSVVYPDLVFVLISGNNVLLRQYAESFGIFLACENPYYEKDSPGFGRAFACRINTIDVNDPEFARSPLTFSGERPADITVHEKIMVIFQILRTTQYGPLPTQHGIMRLLEQGVFSDGYPLHHAQIKWTEEGDLSDRQILARYWANPKYFFKRQPINLIEKYFGAEVAFYFAFLGHLIFILWWAAALGLFCFVYGLMTMFSSQNYRSFETCASKVVMCPTCTNFEVCQYVPLNQSCYHAYMNYVLDNQVIICYAALISVWTTVAMELWKRRQATLSYRWNVFSAHIDLSMRPEYAMTSNLRRLSVVTGEWEPYEDSKVRYTHLFISYSVVTLLAVLAISVIIAIRLYLSVMRKVLATSKVTIFRNYSMLIAPSTASLISVTIMLLLESVYVRLAKVLTELENPRTEIQYDNSLIYKRFALTFINGYAVTIYIAFFQGRFFQHPGAEEEQMLLREVCDFSGCTINIAIHLVIVLLIKSFLMNAVQILKPAIPRWIKNRRRAKRLENVEDLPTWEQQYSLSPLNRFFLVDEYQEIALQYGFVALFSTAFTLAPIFALLHNLISIKVDGGKFLRAFRRPVPVRVPGVIAWEGIFKMITLVGVVINAFVIGFTLEFIPRQIYIYSRNKTRNFVETGLSIFDTDDFPDKKGMQHPKYCYYKSKRHPPGHPRKYQYTKDYWYEIAVRIAFVIIYEQVVFMLTSILAYAIPDTPRSIKEKIEMEKTKLLKKNLAES